MADKSIDQLNEAEKIYATDLFVLQQSGAAKKLTGQILLNWLTAAADGHGGIQSISKLSTSGLVDTYRITLADTTTFDFVVNNGRGITSISKTSTIGLVDTYTISYNDGTSGTLTVTNGEKGDKGDNAYVWIKYASQEPTESSHSMGDLPDNWIGIYSGNASTAPTDWRQYKWFQIKGEKGDTGDAATILSKSVTYQVSDSGTIIPSGSWGSSIPVVSQGKYLWTKTELQFNTGDPIVSYSVARMGIDGSGSVSSVAGVSPDENGNVTLTAADVGALPSDGGDMTGAINMNGHPISGLNNPTEDTQAATKAYTDKMLPKSGGTMTGLINMGGNRITDLGTPTANMDAATKEYSDIAAYPVGAIYISTISTSPASLFGGTWEQIKDVFLLADGNTYSAGTTGGSKTHSLPLGSSGYAKINISGSQGKLFSDFISTSEWTSTRSVDMTVSTASASYSYGSPLGGTTESGDTMPPYLTVYMWKRVA